MPRPSCSCACPCLACTVQFWERVLWQFLGGFAPGNGWLLAAMEPALLPTCVRYHRLSHLRRTGNERADHAGLSCGWHCSLARCIATNLHKVVHATANQPCNSLGEPDTLLERCLQPHSTLDDASSRPLFSTRENCYYRATLARRPGKAQVS